MVTNSEAWQEIADDLHLRPRPGEHRGLKRTAKIGFDKALDDKADAVGDTGAEAVEQREAVKKVGGEMTVKAAIAHVRKHLTGDEADTMIAAIQSGRVPTERVPGRLPRMTPTTPVPPIPVCTSSTPYAFSRSATSAAVRVSLYACSGLEWISRRMSVRSA